jgi:hypothetical protein
MSTNEINVPVLLLGYNRPELLIRRFQELSIQDIGHLTISIDGGGMTEQELKKVENSALEFFDRDRFDFIAHTRNLGLCEHVVSAVSRVLSKDSYVIVLEDDIRVGINFYRNMISGIEFSKKITGIAAVSSFTALGGSRFKIFSARWRETRYFSCWGWAVSREVWEKYELNLANIDISRELSKSVTWKRLNTHQKAVWQGRFSRVKENPSSTWDIQFQFMCFRFDLKILAPTRRFSSNQGFNDIRSEHTSGRMPRWMTLTQEYNDLVLAKQISCASKLYEKIFDENTIAGDSRLVARMRKWKEKSS